MRLSGLSLAVVLLFSSVVLAQHSSGGGGGTGGGGGGGSHGGSVSSGGSGGGHSSGGSGSHSSGGGHNSGGHSSGSISSHSAGHGSQTHNPHSILGSNRGVNTKTAQPEKRSFFSILRHPFRKPEPKPGPKTKLVAEMRRPIHSRPVSSLSPRTWLALSWSIGDAIPVRRATFGVVAPACSRLLFWTTAPDLAE